jgi:hypothetical protein
LHSLHATGFSVTTLVVTILVVILQARVTKATSAKPYYAHKTQKPSKFARFCERQTIRWAWRVKAKIFADLSCFTSGEVSGCLISGEKYQV